MNRQQGSPGTANGTGTATWFSRLARRAGHLAGNSRSFGVAVALVIGWALVGPVFGFSDTWQLVVNTATTIVTFLMVFLLQSSQNRDTTAIQLKLDELIRSVKGARNEMIDLERLDESDLEAIRRKFEQLAKAAERTEPDPSTEGGEPRGT